MNNSYPDRNLDIEELAEYIATASQTIVNEMKNKVKIIWILMKLFKP
ncbi:hypothetical protein [Anabaena sp. UHCC 0253]|nr:hypothetical protein [Anabaena sp. UHCC 0253]